jgi:hypothetical protein
MVHPCSVLYYRQLKLDYLNELDHFVPPVSPSPLYTAGSGAFCVPLRRAAYCPSHPISPTDRGCAAKREGPDTTPVLAPVAAPADKDSRVAAGNLGLVSARGAGRLTACAVLARLGTRSSFRPNSFTSQSILCLPRGRTSE